MRRRLLPGGGRAAHRIKRLRVATPRALLDFVIALGAVVRERGVTTLFTSSPSGRFALSQVPSIARELTSLTDVALELRYVQQGGRIERTILVVQNRGSAHDQAVRRITIDEHGMHIGESANGGADMEVGADGQERSGSPGQDHGDVP